MDDKADLKKLIEVIQSSEKDITDDLQYQKFINLVESVDEDEEEEEEEEEEVDGPEITELYDFKNLFSLNISTIYKYNPISSLKPTEKAVIDTCTDAELKKILLLNRQKSMQLIQMYKKYKDLLIECKQNILDKTEVVSTYVEAFKAQKLSSGAWRVCAPYFKDKNFYISPSNQDSVRKKQNRELSYYDLLPFKKWNTFQTERLMKAVKLNYNNNLITQLKKDIRSLGGEDLTEEQQQELDEMKARLETLSSAENYEIPPKDSDENINWIRVTDIFIKDKHSDFECRAYWHLYVHPSINKTPWKVAEVKQLKELVKKHNYQNWDLIAHELGTNRSCYIVATHYFSNFHSGFKKGEFSIEEDRKLLDLVDKYRTGTHIPWAHIVRHFKYRTRSQLHHRYTYYLSQVDKRLGKFEEAEDVMIILVVHHFGPNFRKVEKYLPERSMTQIKSRYTSNLKEFINKGVWTVEEDEMIVEYADKVRPKTGSWGGLADTLKRARGQIRQRYDNIKTFLKKNPGGSLKDVPRKKHKYRDHDTYNIVRQVADHFLESQPHSIPSMDEIQKALRQFNANKSEYKSELAEITDTELIDSNDSENLDELLTEFFYNIHLQPVAILHSENLRQAVDEVETILDILKVNLEISSELTHPSLDYIDMEILGELSKRNSLTRHSKEIKRLVPVCFHTVSTMRSLLSKYLHYIGDKVKKKESYRIKTERIFGDFNCYLNKPINERTAISKELSRLSDAQKTRLQQDRELFYRRFLSLFKWPAVLTLERPSRDFNSIIETIDISIDTSRPTVKRTYSKRSSNKDAQQANKVIVLDGDAAERLQLTPVTDNSVIVNLLKDNTKKLFCIDKVQEGNETKTLIKEVDLFNLTRNDNEKKPAVTKTYSRYAKKTEPVALEFVKFEAPGTSNCTMDSANSVHIAEDDEYEGGALKSGIITDGINDSKMNITRVKKEKSIHH